VALFQADPSCHDSHILVSLTDCGVERLTAVRIVQFVPIAFTRFLFRDCGVRFADRFVIMGPGGQVMDQKPIAAEPAYQEAWAHCEQAASQGKQDNYFISIAARSGGYRSLMEMAHRGLNLNGVDTSPLILLA
jgi:hypothetical protein